MVTTKKKSIYWGTPEQRELHLRILEDLFLEVPGFGEDGRANHELSIAIVKVLRANVFPNLADIPQGILHEERLIKIVEAGGFLTMAETHTEDQVAAALVERYNDGLPPLAQLVLS